MAKKQRFGEQAARKKSMAQRAMAKVIIAEKKPNGAYRFRERIVPAEEALQLLKAQKS